MNAIERAVAAGTIEESSPETSVDAAINVRVIELKLNVTYCERVKLR
jgi:hypothetical protein